MEAASAEVLYDLLHNDLPYHDGTFTEWSAEPSREFSFHYRAGVSIWVAPVDLAPDEKFTTDRNAVPTNQRGGEDLGDQA